ncbi:MAG TPA: hypothetical protein VLT33_19015 [Labilithrix sp.]|nr:hypothetical protein [Labilithrix sp.]
MTAALSCLDAPPAPAGATPVRAAPETLRSRYAMTRHGGLPLPDGPQALERAEALRDWARRSGIIVAADATATRDLARGGPRRTPRVRCRVDIAFAA